MVIGDKAAASAERMLGLSAHHYLEMAEGIMQGETTHWHIQDLKTSDGLVYMRRHYVSARYAKPQVWIHEILSSDADLYLHDHPWDYRTIILDGSYDEETPITTEQHEAGEQLERTAEALHRLHVTAPAYTLFVTPKARRQWGFMTDSGWVSAQDYRGRGW